MRYITQQACSSGEPNITAGGSGLARIRPLCTGEFVNEVVKSLSFYTVFKVISLTKICIDIENHFNSKSMLLLMFSTF